MPDAMNHPIPSRQWSINNPPLRLWRAVTDSVTEGLSRLSPVAHWLTETRTLVTAAVPLVSPPPHTHALHRRALGDRCRTH